MAKTKSILAQLERLSVRSPFWALMAVAFLISFIGSIPIGALNLTTFQISIDMGPRPAMSFAFAAALAEGLLVYFMYRGFSAWKFKAHPPKWVYIGGLALLLGLSLYNVFKAWQGMEMPMEMDEMEAGGSTFLLGLVLSLSNPLQFPFWLAWNKGFEHLKWLDNKSAGPYALSISIGTILALALFVYFGQRFSVQDYNWARYIYWGLAAIYLILAILVALKVFAKKAK